jgi:hypothetical protein
MMAQLQTNKVKTMPWTQNSDEFFGKDLSVYLSPAPPDYRALCAELLRAWRLGDNIVGPMNRAAAALDAQTEPVAPTDDELDDLADDFLDWNCEGWRAYARAVLARYARSAIQPVPVSERLPGPKDCNADGEAWVEEPAFDYPLHDSGDYDIEPGKWVLRRIAPFDKPNNRRWLPHHALPTPTP